MGGPRTSLVCFTGTGGFVECPMVFRQRLDAGAVVGGSAAIEEMESTTALHPGYRATVD